MTDVLIPTPRAMFGLVDGEWLPLCALWEDCKVVPIREEALPEPFEMWAVKAMSTLIFRFGGKVLDGRIVSLDAALVIHDVGDAEIYTSPDSNPRKVDPDYVLPTGNDFLDALRGVAA